ncbi:MAG: DUF6494 family protein, partial [Alphaproteobacteria bacterium]|nr:DUF6494 family protein [Alphaproteobacteria bacterium]
MASHPGTAVKRQRRPQQIVEQLTRKRYVSREKGLTQLGESAMDEDHFNMEIRKFLKKVGVTSQR